MEEYILCYETCLKWNKDVLYVKRSNLIFHVMMTPKHSKHLQALLLLTYMGKRETVRPVTHRMRSATQDEDCRVLARIANIGHWTHWVQFKVTVQNSDSNQQKGKIHFKNKVVLTSLKFDDLYYYSSLYEAYRLHSRDRK